MPTFTIKEIEIHRKESGKSHGRSIIKTLDRRKKFKDERYLSADSIFTSLGRNGFYVKGKCKANMQKEIRNAIVTLDKKTGLVIVTTCTFAQLVKVVTVITQWLYYLNWQIIPLIT